ncbi:MAG: prealbumin-like fold domain-containing protein [Christensenellales bacterium]
MSLDENGKAVLKSDVPFGSYYVKEIRTDSHYVLSDEKYPVIFAYAGQEIPVVELAVNGGKSITNEMIYGEIHGMKKDEDGKALAGATIGLFLTDGTEPILTTVSAEDGSFSFAGIPYGEYVVREIAAPEGYVMDEAPYAVKVDQNGAVGSRSPTSSFAAAFS